VNPVPGPGDGISASAHVEESVHVENDGRPFATVYLSIGLPEGTMPGGLAEIQAALCDAAREMTEAGRPVRYLNGMYMPAKTRLLCVFAADTEATVHATVESVKLPFVPVRAITDRWDHDPAE
jgi:hypothetical protein